MQGTELAASTFPRLPLAVVRPPREHSPAQVAGSLGPARPARFPFPFRSPLHAASEDRKPCRTAESHGLGATLALLKKGRPSWPTGGEEGPTAEPSTGTVAVGLLETDEQHPSGRDGLSVAYCVDYTHRYASITKTAHEQPRPRTPVEAPAPQLLPGQRLVLVVSRVWPTEGPAFLLLAALDRQTQSSTQYHLSLHTYRALSPLSPPVPSFPPPPSSPARTNQGILLPTHSNPLSACTLLAAPCRHQSPLFLRTL